MICANGSPLLKPDCPGGWRQRYLIWTRGGARNHRTSRSHIEAKERIIPVLYDRIARTLETFETSEFPTTSATRDTPWPDRIPQIQLQLDSTRN